MKRLIVTLVLAALFSTYILSCEKDDICADGTPTTPNLIVEFYNYDNQDELKTVPANFAYYVEGATDSIAPGAVSKIEVPLRVDLTTTKWTFVLPSAKVGGDYNYNNDVLEFKYTTRDEYVSRACGFKTIFTLLTDPADLPNPALTDDTTPQNLWIKDIVVLTPNIENENEVHINIYW